MDLAFHPSGKYLLSAADDGTIRIWDLKTGRCMKRVEAHSPFVQCLSWGRIKTEGKGDDTADATVNVVASGGTDKVRSPFVAMYTSIHVYPFVALSTFQLIKV